MNLIDTLRPFTSFPEAHYSNHKSLHPAVVGHQRYIEPSISVERWRELGNDYAPHSSIELEGYVHELN